MKWKTITETVWDRLKKEQRPIVLYGMGDGADKILKVFESYGIKASGVFASDEFVRGHNFAGFPVRTLAQTIDIFSENIVIVISFASQRAEVLDKMYELNTKFDVVAPDVPVVGDGIFNLEFAKAHEKEIDKVFELLADERSKQVLDNMICFKLTGKIEYLVQGEDDKDEIFTGVLKPTENEHFVDLGAYNGDTIRELLSYTNGKFASITALEPDKRNFKKLTKYVEENLSGDIVLENAGVWDSDCVLTFAAKAGRNSKVANKGVETNMRSVDSVLSGKECTFLKMDVEGSEKEAIFGARNTLKTWKPKLNIAAYHRNEDLFALILQIHEICSEYKFYFRHHPYVPAWDINLYAK